MQDLLKGLSLLLQAIFPKERIQYFQRDCEQQTRVRRLARFSSCEDPPMLKSVMEEK